ncbi:hypothetical protein [Ferrovum myxofaciens]
MMLTDQNRVDDLRSFYGLLDELSETIGGPRTLASSHGRSDWPKRGVYFFFEPEEICHHSDHDLRVVRVGTHALKAGASSTLWERLAQHRGQVKNGGGNHRSSIFRLIVGASLMARDDYYACPTWGQGNSAPSAVRADEIDLEIEVSKVIGAMPLLWLAVDDDPGPQSVRGDIERNAIALLSNHAKEPLDPPSEQWLGAACNRAKVRSSGLWNSGHVDAVYDPRFLGLMATQVEKLRRSR